MMILRVLLLLTLLVLNGCYKAQEPTKKNPASIAGTKVSLTPPDGFIPATQFPGYQLEASGASIMITEIPGPFGEVSGGFSKPDEMTKRGMSLLDRQEIKLNGQTGLLFKIGQKANGTDFLKWILVLGDEKESVVITAAFPKELEAELSEKMKASILTATLDKNKEVPLDEGMNFTIDEKGELKLSKKVSNSLIFSKNGIFPSKDKDEPLFVVGQSITKTAIPDNEEYSKARVLQISHVKDAKIEQSNKVTIDNLDGYEIIAEAKDTQSEQSMTVYQVMLFEEHSYFLMQGLVGSKNRQSALEAFKEMARTFKRKKL